MPTTKQELRDQFNRIRTQLPPEYQHQTSQLICQQLKVYIDTHKLNAIGLFYPFKEEVNLLPLLDWGNKNIQFAAPSTNADWHLTFHRIKSAADFCQSGPYNLLEPASEPIPASELQAIIVPGLVFDRFGNRLGYGKGCYDRYLRNFNGQKLAVCFPEQLAENELPHDAHDQKIDRIFTGTQIILV